MPYVYYYDLYLKTGTKIPYMKKKGKPTKLQNISVESPAHVYNFISNCLDIEDRAEEYLYMIALDVKDSVLGIFEVSHGTVCMTLANPREIFIRALLVGAVSIILVHNHPSGNITPSTADMALSSRIYEAGKLIGIPIRDFIIVSTTGYTSFLEYAILKGEDE